MLKYGGFFVIVTCLAALLGRLPASLLNPLRKSELKILYKIYTEGPGGFDDAVQTHVLKNSDRYSAPLLDMLKKPRPDSTDEEVGLFFVELARGAPEIDEFLNDFAQQHPDPKVREFVRKILRDPVPGRNAL